MKIKLFWNRSIFYGPLNCDYFLNKIKGKYKLARDRNGWWAVYKKGCVVEYISNQEETQLNFKNLKYKQVKKWKRLSSSPKRKKIRISYGHNTK